MARPPNGCLTIPATCWPSLDPKPDQVTVTINTSQMNILEQFDARDIEGTSMEDPAVFNAYKEMTVPAQPGWAEEHIRRLSAAGIQSAFQCYNINSFESVERLMRRGIYKGPLVLNWVAIGGGMDQPVSTAWPILCAPCPTVRCSQWRPRC